MIAIELRAQFEQAIRAAFPDVAIPDFSLEHPADDTHGDFACNIALLLAKPLACKPRDAAERIVAHLASPDIARIEVAGPGFINVFLSLGRLGNEVHRILAERDQYGANSVTQRQTIMLEYAQPNTNKPQHVGHMRNAFYGKAVSNLLEFIGHRVIRATYLGDVGVHIMKSMLAYQKWGEGRTPADEGMKPDHFVGKYYVMFTRAAETDESLMAEAQTMLERWEAGDSEIRTLWELMNSWAYAGWEPTFARMDTTFDEKYYESQYTDAGKAIAKDALARGIAKSADNSAILVDLEPYGLGEKVLLRGDGTSVYMTKELALFRDNYEKYHMDQRLYVVGSDQDHYFRQFFKILELLGHDYGKGGSHLSYGMVRTRDGKMSSREGTVINADDLMDTAHELAEKEIAARHVDIDAQDQSDSAEAIGIGALKYALLHVDARQDIAFDPREAVSFEGNTGPYLQYTYARIQSICKKADAQPATTLDTVQLTDPVDATLLRTVYIFPETVLTAARDYKPHILCNYLFDLAQQFNGYYAHAPILKADPALRDARLTIVAAVAQVLRNGLTLLGIKSLERM